MGDTSDDMMAVLHGDGGHLDDMMAVLHGDGGHLR